MSEIDVDPYFESVEREVFGIVDALLEQDVNARTPADYLCTLEDDIDEIKETYCLTAEELEALGNKIASRLSVKSVLCREKGVYFIRFYIERYP